MSTRQEFRERASALADRVFGMDLRALALFRMSLGVLLLIDLADRSRDIVAHYSDGGAIPRAVVPSADGRLSFHMMSGDPIFVRGLMMLAALFALGLLLGYRTRLCVFASWVLNFSLQTRNPLVLYGGDIVLREILFWSNFLPLGRALSVDAKQTEPAARVCTVGSAAYLVQIALIYITTVLLKTGADWHNGTAVWYTLQIDHFTSPLGREFLAYPRALNVLTYAVYWFEAVGPWLLLVPRWWVRLPVVLGFVGMHLSFEAFMEIGLFPWISAASWIPLLPSEALDRLRLRRLSGPTLRASPLVQGVCAVALLYVTWWNLGSVYPQVFSVKGDWRVPARVLRLDQYWDMFAPAPLKDDGWFILVGSRKDGKEDDLLHGGPVTWAKPYNVSQNYKNERWRKYMRNLWNKKYASMRDPYLRWLCRSWNRNASENAQVTKITMYYMLERSPAPGETATVEKVRLRTLECKPPG